MPERPRPNIAATGVLISNPRDQSVVKDDLRRHVEGATDWEYQESAAYLYRWAVLFKERLLDPVLLTDRGRMPDPVISFDKMRIEALAAYTLVRNPQGLLDEITINTVHFTSEPGAEKPHLVWRFGEWGLLETLLHEQVHLWQQNFGKKPVKPGKAYHNAEFVAKCESLGLHPRLGIGCHYKPADGVFAAIMKEHGIAQPPEVEASGRLDWWDLLDFLAGKEQKGKSTLSKWSCGCQVVRVGTKEFYAQCLRCGGLFVKVEGKVPQTASREQELYTAGEAEQRMSWQDHEQGIYQPLIHSLRIRELHEIVVLTGEPMTVLLDMAIREFYERQRRGSLPFETSSADSDQ